MIRRLESDELALYVASAAHYNLFHAMARVELEQEGRTLPETYVWMIARKGHWGRRYVLFSNQPPPWEEPQLPAGMVTHHEKLLAKLRQQAAESSQPATQPQPVLPSDG
jgi:hypothetical protein